MLQNLTWHSVVSLSNPALDCALCCVTLLSVELFPAPVDPTHTMHALSLLFSFVFVTLAKTVSFISMALPPATTEGGRTSCLCLFPKRRLDSRAEFERKKSTMLKIYTLIRMLAAALVSVRDSSCQFGDSFSLLRFVRASDPLLSSLLCQRKV